MKQPVNIIKWNAKALRQLTKLPLDRRKSIIDAVEALPGEHGLRQVKTLTNHRYTYRLRVGRYRIFFDIDIDIETGEVKIYLIQEVKKRDEHTY